MPTYCETSLNPLGSFPAEPVNSVTSFVPVILGVLALTFLVRHRQTSKLRYALSVLTILTGMGSVAWHAFRTEFALAIDVLPGLLYFVTIALSWAYYVGNRYAAIALAATVLGMVVVIPRAAGPASLIIFVSVILLLAAGLVAATWYRKRQAFGFALLAVGSATMAATFRTLDRSMCDVIPVGTHFFWHIFLGLAAYAGVRMMVLLESHTDASVR